MKKILCFLGVLCLLLVGCNTAHLSQEQSRNNFQEYENSLKTILISYDLTLEPQRSEDTAYGLYRSYSVSLDSTANISINFSSNATPDDTGREDFEIIYRTCNADSFDLALFTELVNAVSGMTLSQDDCETFLSDPEEDHSPERYNLSKTEDQMIWKYEFLNFGEDWAMGYSLYADETEELTFGGLTKLGTNQ